MFFRVGGCVYTRVLTFYTLLIIAMNCVPRNLNWRTLACAPNTQSFSNFQNLMHKNMFCVCVGWWCEYARVHTLLDVTNSYTHITRCY